MIEKLPDKELLRPDEVARYINVSKSTIYGWIYSGRLEAVKIAGRSIRIHRDAVEKIQRSALED